MPEPVRNAESVLVQPFSEEEIEHLAAFASIDPAKVRGIAWLTALKLQAEHSDGPGFTRNEKGMVTGGPWPKRAGEDTVELHNDGSND